MLSSNSMSWIQRVLTATALLVLIVGSAPQSIRAQEGTHRLTVTPAVIDEKAKTRDILNETITLENTSIHKIIVFPGVNDVQVIDGKQRFSGALDGTSTAQSLAAWIELSRATVELMPGEKKTVPFLVRVDSNAAPGSYHATISFSEGGTREEAEKQPPLGTVVVNVDVQADIKEILQLDAFTTDNVYLSGDDVLFNYRFENIGNQELQPHGDIRIYNRKGEEVASVDVNKEGKPVSPDKVAQLASVWTGAQGFGQYKALLNVYYGQSQVASVQDTVFFWIIPWKELLALFVVGLIALVGAAFYAERWFERRAGGEGLAYAHISPTKPTAPVATATALAREPSPSFFSRFRFKKRALVTPSPPLSAVLPVPLRPQFPSVGAPVLSMRQHLESMQMPPSVVQAASVPLPLPPVPQMVITPPTPFARQETQAAEVGTIDLTRLRMHAETISDSHVINLKPRQ